MIPAGDFSIIRERFEAALNQGQMQLVAKALAEFNPDEVPRAWRLPLATISRRAGLANIGLRLLSPVMRPPAPHLADPSPAEAAEYAILLQRNGLLHEALDLLEHIPTAQAPEVLLFKAFCHFSTWDYEAAVPLLEEYTAQLPSGIETVPAHSHLASAYLTTGRYAEARELLNRILPVAEANPRLAASCLELKAQLAFHLRDLGAAKRHIEESFGLLRRNGGITDPYSSKWHAAIAAHEARSVQPLRNYREQAIRRQDPEAVRETDFLILQMAFNQEEFNFLYFGTPFEAYRSRLRLTLGRAPFSPELILGDEQATARLDLLTGEIAGYAGMSQGSKVHQLFDVLFRDFYRPCSIGRLFDGLFPGEPFDVEHSPDRVHQVLRRARRYLEASNLPMVITSYQGNFAAQITGHLGVRIPLERPRPDVNSIQIQRLRAHFQGEPFSAREAREALALSPAEFKRLAAWGVESGVLEKLGASSATVYAVVRRRSA